MIYYLSANDKLDLSPVAHATLAKLGWSEKDLENLIAEHIGQIIREDQLLIIGQERRYQEEPDILALDSSGTLFIFELKRWKSSPENLLQVLRYGQIFGQRDYSALEHTFRKYRAKESAATPPQEYKELDQVHRAYFDLPEPIPRSSFNHAQRFIVVTDGVDRSTREAIEYWGRQGLPVSAAVYHVYLTRGNDILFEVRPYGPEGDVIEDLPEGLAVVNTNSTYMPNAWREMLAESKVAAYYSRKTAANRIKKGTPVALYHTGVGIIAVGKAVADVRRADRGVDLEAEHYVKCDFEVAIDPIAEPDKAVTAREINQFLGSSHRFRQTIHTLPAKATDFIRTELLKRSIVL